MNIGSFLRIINEQFIEHESGGCIIETIPSNAPEGNTSNVSVGNPPPSNVAVGFMLPQYGWVFVVVRIKHKVRTTNENTPFKMTR